MVGLVGRWGGGTMPASGRAQYGLSSGGRSVAGISHSQLLGLSDSPSCGGLEAGVLTRVDLASGQDSNHDLGYRGRSSPRGSLYASQAGRKVMGREVRDLAVASSGGEPCCC